MRDFVVEWNHRFPMDLWWRRRHRIPFGSPQHRKMSLLDIFFDLQEEIMIKESIRKADFPYVPGESNWGSPITEIDEGEMFDSIDLDSI